MDMGLLLLAVVGLVLGLCGRRSVAMRRTGAVLVGTDALRRIVEYPLQLLSGALQTAYAGQVHASLLWALVEILIILRLWKAPQPR